MSDTRIGHAGEVVVRVGIDLTPEEAEFYNRYADYRNAYAKAQGIPLRRKWTRKSLIESLLAGAKDHHRFQLRAMFEACGPFPTEKDDKAMALYVQKVLEWSAAQEAESAKSE